MKIREENHRRRKVGTLTIDDLYDCYYNELVLWADTILNDMDMAEDLVQDLFVALWEKGIDRQLESKGVRAYLYTAVRNKAVRALKGERKTVDLPDIADMLMVWEDVDMSRQQLLELVIGELEKLPPRSREVLECIHLKNMKYAEVAEAFGSDGQNAFGEKFENFTEVTSRFGLSVLCIVFQERILSFLG